MALQGIRYARACVGGALALLLSPVPAIAWQDSDDEVVNTIAPRPDEVDSSTVIYDREFIESFPNAVSVVDIVERIPGGMKILGGGRGQGGGGGGGGGRRGFSSGDDRVLINGRRVSGKSNDSRGALSRITVDQVRRIELIRGSSPDIKVSSQEAIINVVLFESTGGGSGSWRATMRSNRFKSFVPGGFLSYGGNRGAFDYFLSLEGNPRQRDQSTRELDFDAAGNLVSSQREFLNRDAYGYEFSGNFGYEFKDGTRLRVNGQISGFDADENQAGSSEVLDPATGGFDLVENLRLVNTTAPAWELSSDLESELGSNLTIKLLGLRSESESDRQQSEDPDIFGALAGDPDRLREASKSRRETQSVESIGRGSLVWNARPGTVLEFGSEISFNRLDSQLDDYEFIGGELVPTAPDDVRVSETRSESFLIHTWQATRKLSLETSLFYEYSKITVAGEAPRTFNFFRPSTDIRYNINDSNQMQLSVRREISQLNFNNFASSVNDDDEPVQGNNLLSPEQAWEVEASYEHRLQNDGGFVKLTLKWKRTTDKIQTIPIGETSGTGNFGVAKGKQVRLDWNLRLGQFGLPDLLIESALKVTDQTVDDPFTGERRIQNFLRPVEFSIGFRHDLNDLGFSYGVDYRFEGQNEFRDDDEIVLFAAPRQSLGLWVEKRIFWALVLKLEGTNLLNTGFGRDRLLFDDNGIAGGVRDGRELQIRPGGRSLFATLSGTF